MRINKPVKCKICGLDTVTNGMQSHLKYKHNLVPLEYIKKYGEYRPKYLDYISRADSSNNECLICKEKFASERHLSYHIRIDHKVSKKDYVVTYILNSIIPICKCGCDELVTVLLYPPYIREYKSGHNFTDIKCKGNKRIISNMYDKYVHITGRYLDEEYLGTYLTKIYPNMIFNRNKKIGNYIPDYSNELLKVAVEFDGPRHYTESSTIIRDMNRKIHYDNLGYKLIRIPYFIQLDSLVIQKLFNVSIDIQLEYPHGFIHPNVVLPADYCSLGIEVFKNDLLRFDMCVDDIKQSLEYQCVIRKHRDKVYPLYFTL